MEIRVTAKPHMLLETIELLFAYINSVPADALTADGEYCLPVEAVQQMMDVACAGISRNDPVMSYYFGKHALTDGRGRATCIARNLVYDSMEVSTGSVSSDCDGLRDFWLQRHAHNMRIDTISEFGLTYLEPVEDHYVPLARDISGLPVSQEYAQMLLEQFSNYPDSIARLAHLLTPVAEKLEPLLEPWTRRAAPLAQPWEDWLKHPEAMSQFLKKRACVKSDESIISLRIQLRYLMPGQGPGMGKGDMPNASLFLHIGVALPIEKQEASGFSPWEFEALRLLGGEARMRMLRLMLDKPMSARELTKLLGLHLGTVCRDINSLYSAKLLIIECVDGKRRYRTNMDTIRLISKHMVDLKEFEAL